MEDLTNINFNKIRLSFKVCKYLVTYFNKKIKLECNNALFPYGIETYNDNSILNIQLNAVTNNQHNINNYLLAIDSYFQNKQELKNKEFVPSIKKIDNDIIIRTHLNNKTEINGEYFNTIKNKTGSIYVELSHIWTFEDKYGLYWTINTIDLD